jgi:cytochrome c oxidase subunit 3/cytochrome o ubiquinol oxidase subunit 3
MINEAYLSIAPEATEWKLPSARKVAIVCLVLTETTLFSIFVAGYLFYIGKSLTGPTPREVLDLPVLATICLLSIAIVWVSSSSSGSRQLSSVFCFLP